MKRVLIVGGGGREHAIAWKLAQSPKVEEIFCAPGNAGTASIAQNLPVRAEDVEGIVRIAKERRVDYVIVGPEGPLALGLVDALEREGIGAFGPSRAAAEIETSKVFARKLAEKYGIPHPRFRAFDSYEEAERYLAEAGAPIVVKADGLAAGKGSFVAETLEEALKALEDIMIRRIFGPSGDKVVIEEKLSGREVSFMALTDGRTVIPMVPAADYKRLLEGDRGPNTGGMGSYSPPPFFGPELQEEALERILKRAVRALEEEGRPYKGVLYGGLMLTEEGPKVLEFNARFGDPENQAMLPRLKTDLLDIVEGVIEGRLDRVKVEWREEACVAVVLASRGYPGKYETGFEIRGLDEVDPDVMVFHAGTKLEGGKILTSGGRVLAVSALGRDLREAREKAYRNAERIRFENRYFRRDIAEGL